MSEHIYAFTIEGLGKTSAVSVSADDRLWRFATGTPAAAADTNGLYKPWLRKGSADTALRIAPIRQRLDYQTGKYTIEGCTLHLLGGAGDADLSPLEAFCRPKHYKIGDVTAAHTADLTDTTITLDTAATGLAGVEIGSKRERIKLGTESGTGNYINCVRAIHDSRLEAVDPALDLEDTEVYQTHTHATLQSRRITLLSLPPGAQALSEESVLWSGVLDSIGYKSAATGIDVQARGFASLMSATTLHPDSWVGFVPGHIGSALVWCVAQEVPGETVQRHPVSVGEAVAASTFFYGRIRDSVYRFDHSGSAESGLYLMDHRLGPLFDTEAVDLDDIDGEVVREVLHMYPDAPTPSASPGNATLPLGGADGDWITCLLQVLTSTTTASGNGAYDVGVDFGFGLPADLIDTASFLEIKYALGERLHMDRVFVGGDKDPPAALKWIEAHNQALQVCFTTTAAGKLGLCRFTDSPLSTTTVPTHADAQMVQGSAALVDMGTRRIVDKLSAKYRRSGAGDTRTLNVNSTSRQQRTIGPSNKTSLDLGAWSGWSAAFRQAQEYLFRYARVLPLVEWQMLLSAHVPPGTIVELSSAQVVGLTDAGAAQEGVTAARVVLQEVVLDLATHTTTCKGYLSAIGVKLRSIAPWAYITGSNTGARIPVAANTAQPAAGGVYDTDREQFAAGDKVAILDQYGTSVQTGLEVASTGSLYIDLTGAPSGATAAGNVLVTDDHDRQSAAQRAAWVSICNTSGVLTASPTNLPACQYE